MKKLMFLIISSVCLLSCNIMGDYVSGNGTIKDEKRDISTFHGVGTSGSIDVEINSGDHYSVTVENDENLLQYVVTDLKDGVLNIHYKNGYNISNDHAKVIVTAPSLDKISTSGSGDISATGVIKNTNTIEFSLSGSGDVSATVDAPAVHVSGSGSGTIKLSGKTKDFECKLSGSGDVDCGNLQSENATISVAGSSDVHVFASVHLKVNVAGSGDVYYQGNPSAPEIHIAGSGSVQAQK
ncbi:MAG: head GIN domain-containing protein [Ginsengibacter sp.]